MADHTFENEIIIPGVNGEAVAGNKLEALKVLADSILSEVRLLGEAKLAIGRKDQIDLSEEVSRFEADIIRCALVRTGGRQRQAARLLNVKPTTLHSKLRRYGIVGYEIQDAA